jgi:hypothetical protein
MLNSEIKIESGGNGRSITVSTYEQHGMRLEIPRCPTMEVVK